ncbi:FHA domain-containing protein [Actinokineospora pegani]|uniref:FHA domain-containing protein n=1 Tax=Actinokineospora pegani TaxID=2654637 RepID=UPI002E26160E
MYFLEPLTPSLLRHEPLVAGGPAPVGTLFVLGQDGGYAATPHPARTLVLGRNSPDVHVTVGSEDWYVSREHATLRCARDGRWTLRNGGKLPIRIPETPALLHQHEAPVPCGYTPLYIQGSRLHVVELLVSAGPRGAGEVRPGTGTRDLAWPLSDRERLVLVALFQLHLLRADDAHPLSWNETARCLNEVPGQRGWNDRKAEHAVDGVRKRLAAAGVGGVTADSAPADAIKRNLLRVLVDTATLAPPDLRLLDEGVDSPRRNEQSGVVR